MILRLHSRWRRLRRLFSPTEWMVGLLGLPRDPGDESPGLVMIQIDGLSHGEMQRALRAGEMPFISRLLRREDYAMEKLYSGLPSNTPSMQGELFYGVPGSVPAFGFFHKGGKRVCRMLEPESAREVEKELAAQGEPLLKGGSAYSDIFTGGAREPRWCAASMGWGIATKSPGPFLMLALAFINLFGFLRAAAFGFLELGIAVIDAIRGVWGGAKPRHEFSFIPSRVGVCVLLREWITHAARMDVARGLPVVHVNFVGYDEQAHHRGPDSAFAHWVLRGIDDSIKRIWHAAKDADRRPYDVWIYSDHGQVLSTPYVAATGKTMRERVTELWEDGLPEGDGVAETSAPIKASRFQKNPRFQKKDVTTENSVKHQGVLRSAHGGLRSPSSPPADSSGATGAPVKYPVVADYGPVALVQLEESAGDEACVKLGERLAREAAVPIVLDARAAARGEGLRGWTAKGAFTLPADADAVLGNHPFREALVPDLERLCRHRHAGDLVLLGWKRGMPRPLTFAYEFGAHGGISPEECTAFVMLPNDLARDSLGPGFLRPADLRRAALLFMGRDEPVRASSPSSSAAPVAFVAPSAIPTPTAGMPVRLRVMTYNVHSCIGLDQRHDARRIARVIAHYHPDVVALQEVESGHARSSGIHQARQIASLLRFEYHFHSVREVQDRQFGNAILSRYPLEIVKVGGLPSPATERRKPEARGALWVEVEVAGRRVQILNTHLGLGGEERKLQVKALLGPEWLGAREPGVPVILCGDLNCGPGSPPYRQLLRALEDCQLQAPRHKPRNTWFASLPLRRIDHLFVTEPLRTEHVHVPRFRLAKAASDHLPLVADLILPPEAPPNGPAREASEKRRDDHVA